MQKYRKITQCTFFLLMIIIPILNILEIYFIKGTYISLDVGSLSVSDPLAILQAAFISQEILPVMIASITIPILIVMILGRVWCSWCCPYYLITDFIAYIKKRFKSNNKKLYLNNNIPLANFTRYLILILGFISVGILGIPILFLLSPPSILSSQSILIIKYFTITFEILLIPLIIIIELIFIDRFWCRFACPTGSCLSLFQNKKGLHPKYIGNCSNCKKCVKNCPIKLDPRIDNLNSQCNNCGQCIDVCPDNKSKKTIYWNF